MPKRHRTTRGGSATIAARFCERTAGSRKARATPAQEPRGSRRNLAGVTTLEVRDRAQWRAWLAENHATASAIWLVYYKKHTGLPGPSYDEAVEEALCFGWIDGLERRLDDGANRREDLRRKNEEKMQKRRENDSPLKRCL